LQRENHLADPAHRRTAYYLSVGIQAASVAYIVCSLFASIQYLWYLYYPVAYAIALRRLEMKESPPEPEPIPYWADIIDDKVENRLEPSPEGGTRRMIEI
jgi:hypothetical protein